VLTPDRFVRGNLPRATAFVAATCYQDYRRHGGRRATVLPDFFIGAHATVLVLQLLTRDAARYRTYFPTVDVIAPA
jgi:predicted nucleic acid-binding protein